jgi:hypothetical protein
VHLPLHEHRVENDAAIVDGDVAEQPHIARLGIDLNDGEVRPERIRRARSLEIVFHVEGPGEGFRRSFRHRTRELGPPDTRAGDPGHLEPPLAAQDHVIRGDLEHVRCERAGALEQDVGGAEDRAPTHLKRP